MQRNYKLESPGGIQERRTWKTGIYCKKDGLFGRGNTGFS